jgi:hypothetical protein
MIEGFGRGLAQAGNNMIYQNQPYTVAPAPVNAPVYPVVAPTTGTPAPVNPPVYPVVNPYPVYRAPVVVPLGTSHVVNTVNYAQGVNAQLVAQYPLPIQRQYIHNQTMLTLQAGWSAQPVTVAPANQPNGSLGGD